MFQQWSCPCFVLVFSLRGAQPCVLARLPSTADLTTASPPGRRARSASRQHRPRHAGTFPGVEGQCRADRSQWPVDEFADLAYHGMRAQDRRSTSPSSETSTKRSEPSRWSRSLGRVFLNIISNALQATFERAKQQGEEYHPTLWLSTRRQAGEIEIRIRDNGPGMPQPFSTRFSSPSSPPNRRERGPGWVSRFPMTSWSSSTMDGCTLTPSKAGAPSLSSGCLVVRPSPQKAHRRSTGSQVRCIVDVPASSVRKRFRHRTSAVTPSALVASGPWPFTEDALLSLRRATPTSADLP